MVECNGGDVGIAVNKDQLVDDRGGGNQSVNCRQTFWGDGAQPNRLVSNCLIGSYDLRKQRGINLPNFRPMCLSIDCFQAALYL